MKKLLVMIGFVALLAGCQTAPPAATPVLDNHTFMSLWSIYRHCTHSGDLDQLRGDVRALNQATAFRTSYTDFSVPLPEMILRHVSAQPTRVAADPTAMAAACSIRTAQVALEVGNNEVATELLNGVVRDYSKSAYAYYVHQAETMLHRLQGEVVFIGQAAGPATEQVQALPVAPARPSRSSLPAADSLQY